MKAFIFQTHWNAQIYIILTPELMNQEIVYMNSVTGKFPDSLHVETMSTQIPVTWLRTTSTHNIVESHRLN